MKKIHKSDFVKATMKAVYKTFYRELVRNTPGKGTVADAWEVEMEGDDVVIINREYGQIVRYLEYGTRPHVIKPKNAKSLRFKVGPGDKFAFAKKVNHPGIEARRFVQGVMENPINNQNFEIEFDKEIRKLI